MADDSKKRNWEALWNTWSGAASVLGALALLNMVQGFVELKQGLRDLLSAWSAVVSPISNALFGWIRVALSIDLPKGFEDYLTLGVIAGAAAARAIWIAMREVELARATQLPQIAATEIDLWSARRPYDTIEFAERYLAERSAEMDSDRVAAIAHAMKNIEEADRRDLFYDHSVTGIETDIANDLDRRKLSVPRSFYRWETWLYWPLLPLWPLAFAWYAFRVRVLAHDRFAVFLTHSFAFVIVALMIVAASYAFFWLP